MDHLKLSSHETQRPPIPLDPPLTQTETDSDEIPESQPQRIEPHAQESLDDLIKYLDNFSFDGYQHPDLSGKLPQLEAAYAKFMACYLRAALNLRG